MSDLLLQIFLQQKNWGIFALETRIKFYFKLIWEEAVQITIFAVNCPNLVGNMQSHNFWKLWSTKIYFQIQALPEAKRLKHYSPSKKGWKGGGEVNEVTERQHFIDHLSILHHWYFFMTQFLRETSESKDLSRTVFI